MSVASRDAASRYALMKSAYTLRKRLQRNRVPGVREVFECDLSASDSANRVDGGRDRPLLEVIDHFAETERHVAQHVARLQHALYRHQVPGIESRPLCEGD